MQCGRPGFDSWVRKIPCRRKWKLYPVFLPGEFYGQRSLAGYSVWRHKELDMIEQLTHTTGFRWNLLRFSIHKTAINTQTLLRLPFWFGCLVFLLLAWFLQLGLFSAMLSRSGESRHPHLIPDLRGRAFNFWPLSVMLTVGLSYMAILMLRYVPSMPNLLRVFSMNGCWILSSTFSASLVMIL